MVVMAPIVVYTFLGLHLPVYDANSCAAIESESIGMYLYFAEALFICAAVVLVFKSYRRATNAIQKKKNLLAGVGGLSFLIFLFSATFAVSLLAESDASLYVYNYEIYGLFGMPIFLIFLGYLIVHYGAFKLKIFNTQALVILLVSLVISEYTFITSLAGQILLGFTLFTTSIVGIVLIRSSQKERAQREQIEDLAKNLLNANNRLKELDKMKSEFVSIASHQLRSPLTSIRGYASMLTEGSYGKLPAKAQEAVEKIAESSKYMALSVEDYLSVSRIEAGNMQYDNVDFNVKELAEKLVDELRPVALKRGLVIVFRSDCSGSCAIHADIGKVRQVIMNIIDNSMKYTQKGTITVVAHDNVQAKTMRITIQDTGVGMSAETLDEVFEKFVRAKNAHNINTTGTGLGLFVAKKMVESMGGKVWAESDGEGKGSRFCVEFGV
jgi:signal transduction histidine kinase